jgi:hypothetical protein
MVLFDNLGGTIGGPSLDAALTATEWQDRLLSTNKSPRLPLVVTWYATGNNTVLRADTGRRTCQIRLESPLERPEDRADVRQPDLLGWVRRERGRLLCAALTILSAYCRAGRPDQRLKPWGSFEGWSALVRGAVVWTGLEDPGKARMTGPESADKEAEALQGLIAGWRELDPEGRGLTTRQAVDLLRDPENRGRFPTMLDVIAEVFGEPPDRLKTDRLGYKLRTFAGRNCGGYCFVGESGHTKVTRWRVVSMASRGGDGGDGGDHIAEASARGKTHSCQKVEAMKTSPPSPPSPPQGEQSAGSDLEEVEL